MTFLKLPLRNLGGLLCALVLTTACGDDDAVEPTFEVNDSVDASADAAIQAPTDDAGSGNDTGGNHTTEEATATVANSADVDAAVPDESSGAGETLSSGDAAVTPGTDESTAPVGTQTEVTSAPAETTSEPGETSGPVDADCFTNPQTHFEIINACTTAVKIKKTPNLVGLNEDGSLPPLP